jgi:hypothetical protein
MTFLLVGDQNAGKSTFLHSFCRHYDAHFLSLSSLLPLLSSTFVNTRFLWEDDQRPPIDEPPFIVRVQPATSRKERGLRAPVPVCSSRMLNRPTTTSEKRAQGHTTESALSRPQ